MGPSGPVGPQWLLETLKFHLIWLLRPLLACLRAPAALWGYSGHLRNIKVSFYLATDYWGQSAVLWWTIIKDVVCWFSSFDLFLFSKYKFFFLKYFFFISPGHLQGVPGGPVRHCDNLMWQISVAQVWKQNCLNHIMATKLTLAPSMAIEVSAFYDIEINRHVKD